MPLPIPELQTALLDWYRLHRRSLPWREAPSLYKTVVSELMCQQTQIKTALPYFHRWLEELPDFAALAAAPEAKVLKLWEGLGYYSRARNLHRLAQELCRFPSPPKDAASWEKLPGIGPYTAAAITSISFGTPSACVDGNVVRILTRWTADTRDFRDSASAAKALRPLADKVLNHAEPGDHNQAMMELGATVCTKHNPACVLCPVQAWCEGRKQGIAESLPRLASKTIEQRQVLRLLCINQGRILLHRASETSRRLANQHELPASEQIPGLSSATAERLELLAVKKRSITRFQITEHIHRLVEPPRPLPPELVWVLMEKLPEITLSGPHRRWLESLLKSCH